MLDKIYKEFVAKIEVDTDERSITAIISTEGVDRENEVLLPKGAKFDAYLKNPVVLWAHNYSATPIARSAWIKRGRDSNRNVIKAKAVFAETDKANEVYELFKGGFLNAFSVGFLPLKSHRPTPDEIKKKPEWAEATRIFDEWEMLEFSAVPVPANSEALAIAVKGNEIVLSSTTKSELGVEEVFYPAKDTVVVKEKKETEPKEAEITLTEPIKLKVHKRIQLKQKIDTDKIADRVKSRITGKMYG